MFFSSFVEIYIFSILEVCRSSPRLPVPPRGIIVLTMQVWSELFRQINIYQFSIVDRNVGDDVQVLLTDLFIVPSAAFLASCEVAALWSY